jgi:hypothetical protein
MEGIVAKVTVNGVHQQATVSMSRRTLNHRAKIRSKSDFIDKGVRILQHL